MKRAQKMISIMSRPIKEDEQVNIFNSSRADSRVIELRYGKLELSLGF